MMAHEILAMKQQKGISIDNVTSRKIETEGYFFDPRLEKQNPPPSLKQP